MALTHNVCPAPWLLEHLPDEPLLISEATSITFFPHALEATAVRLRDGIHAQLGLRLGVEASLAPAPGDLHLALAHSIPELDGLPNREEGYVLLVTEQGARLTALALAGLAHAAATLLQLLPAAEEGRGGTDAARARVLVSVEVPGARVLDAPRFPWRGLLLDCSRHFFAPPFLRRVLDLMAAYKLNRLHWHLVDDQGWRLEVPGLPKLTGVGAWRRATAGTSAAAAAAAEGGAAAFGGTGAGGEAGGGWYGGYYSQEDVAGIVGYAAEKGITVVPEIELPGHCIAALAAYPDLSCFGDVREVATEWGVHPESAYCAGREGTFEFLEAVLDHTLRLFPSEVIHIGGDEVMKRQWEQCPLCQQRIAEEGVGDEEGLQAWFVGRAQALLAARGRRIMGWDEIMHGDLPRRALVMSWRGTEGGVRAARAGHDVVMTPASLCYLDHRQAEGEEEPGVPGTALSLEAVYSFDPVPPEPAAPAAAEEEAVQEAAAEAAAEEEDEDYVMVSRAAGAGEEEEEAEEEDKGPAVAGGSGRDALTLTPEEAKHILGGQANLWTEFVPSPGVAEYMLLPRLCAMAEALWSQKERKGWADFRRRVAAHEAGWRRAGYAFRPLDA